MLNLRTTSEVATTLGMSRREVLRLVERDELTPAAKLPAATGSYLFDADAVAALAAERAR